MAYFVAPAVAMHARAVSAVVPWRVACPGGGVFLTGFIVLRNSNPLA